MTFSLFLAMRHPLTISVLLSAVVAAGLATSSSGVLRSSGPPNDVCAAPPTFQACNDCHTGAERNSTNGLLSIFGVPAVYTPGQIYTLQVELGEASASRWGFEITALDDALDGAGSFTATDAEVQVSVAGSVQYAKHTSFGTSVGTTGIKTWQFEWTAPIASTGVVRFYAAGNGANGNGSNSGDMIYTAAIASAESASEDATVTLQPESTLVTPGSSWRVDAFVRDHSGSTNQVLLVSRVKLPSGSFFPSNGWLFPPATIDLVGGGEARRILNHTIPLTAPSFTATYQGIVGRAPNKLVDINEFQFTIQ
jgi:hypothetical protein